MTNVNIPANVEAEQMLLGAILINNQTLHQVGEFLSCEHFYEEIHQKLFKAVTHIFDKGLSITPVSMIGAMGNDEQFQAVGGRQYLGQLIALAAGVFNPMEYARIIHSCAIKRQLITVAQETIESTYASNITDEPAQLIESMEHKLFQLASIGSSEKQFIHVNAPLSESIAIINRTMKNNSRITGITTGLIDLDAKLLGFHNSDLVILAGRPSMGKTALALNFAVSAATELHQRHKDEAIVPCVGFVSLEMSSTQLTTRIIAMQSMVDSSVMRSGKVSQNEYLAIRNSAQELAKLPLFIDDSGALTISAIRTRARRLKRKHNLAILFIDYLQLINSTNKRDNRALEVSEITQQLKALAKDLNIPIIVLSQLSRAVESRDDKRPMLSDLRESGAIEQDADIVMFVYREEYYLSRKEPPLSQTAKHDEWVRALAQVHNQAEIIVAKHRNGSIGNITLHYDGKHSKFADRDRYHGGGGDEDF